MLTPLTRYFHMAFLLLLLSALPLWPQGAGVPSAKGAGRVSVETIPFPPGVARPGPDVRYTAPAFPELRQTLSYDGRAGLYYLYAPPRSSPEPRPAIVLLHGARRSGRSMIEMWRATADRHGAILIAPDSFGDSWSPADDHSAGRG